MKKSNVVGLVLLGLVVTAVVATQTFGIRVVDIVSWIGLEPSDSRTVYVLGFGDLDTSRDDGSALVALVLAVEGVAEAELATDENGAPLLAFTCKDLGWSFGNEVLAAVKAAIPERYGAWLKSAQHTQSGLRFKQED